MAIPLPNSSPTFSSDPPCSSSSESSCAPSTRNKRSSASPTYSSKSAWAIPSSSCWPACCLRTQAIAAAAILILYWAAFALYPLPAAGFDYSSVGLPSSWPHLTGFYAHWDKSTHLAAAFDRWFLNLFPQAKPFRFNAFGTSTLNFIPSLAIMIFGLLAGNLLRSILPAQRKLLILLAAGLAGILLGQLLESIGVCPIVRKVWSPSWALYSTGWVFLLLAAFYAVIDILGLHAWAFPLVVVGMNSIAMYVLAHTSADFITSNLKTHLGQNLFAHPSPAFAPLLQSLALLLTWWLILLWMYRRKIFLRV